MTNSTTIDPTSNRSTMARIIGPGAGTLPAFEHPALPKLEVKLDASASLGFSVLEYTAPAGFSPPPVLHRHTRESAVGYVADGELTYWFDDEQPVAAPTGSVVVLPAGAWFRWANTGDRPARMLFVFQPAGFEQFFVQIMQAVADAGGDPSALRDVIHPIRAAFGDEDKPAG